MASATSFHASAQPAKKPFWRTRWMYKNKNKTVKPRLLTLLLTSSHRLEKPKHRPGITRPPWMLIDCYGGEKARNLKTELETKELPSGLRHAVVILGGNDVSVPPRRRSTAKKPDDETADVTTWDPVQVYHRLKYVRLVERVTVVALLPSETQRWELPTRSCRQDQRPAEILVTAGIETCSSPRVLSRRTFMMAPTSRGEVMNAWWHNCLSGAPRCSLYFQGSFKSPQLLQRDNSSAVASIKSYTHTSILMHAFHIITQRLLFQ